MVPNTNNMHVLFFGVPQDKNDISATRTAALIGLPLYLKEDPSNVIRTCKVFLFSTFCIRLEFHVSGSGYINVVY